MAFTTHYEYDIFLSYAHRDNTAVCWIDEFEKYLFSVLDEQLGFEPAIYRDINRPRNKRINKDIDIALKKSALFLLILSDNYINSGWCSEELKSFSAHFSLPY